VTRPALRLQSACTEAAVTHEPIALAVHPVQSASPYRGALRFSGTDRTSSPRTIEQRDATVPILPRPHTGDPAAISRALAQLVRDRWAAESRRPVEDRRTLRLVVIKQDP
jgi:hypothetical protein